MDFKSFRKAVAVGNKTIAANQKTPKLMKKSVVYYSPDGKKFEVDVYLKKLTCLDYEQFSAIQYKYDGEDQIKVCSRYSAIVIVGTFEDEEGEVRAFDIENSVAFLECSDNATQTMLLSQAILAKSELTADTQDAKKPAL
jgi:hypothetical protein